MGDINYHVPTLVAVYYKHLGRKWSTNKNDQCGGTCLQRQLDFNFLFYIDKVIYLFIYGYAGSSLLLGLFSSCGARVSHCGGFPCCRASLEGGQASLVVVCALSSFGSWVLENGLSSCGTWA